MAVLGISFAAALIWIWVLKKFDTTAKVKKSGGSIHAFFLYGLLSIPLLSLIHAVLDPVLYPIASVSLFTYQIIYVGLVEETSKFLVFFLISVMGSSIKEPKDGILHAASVGLAFAIIENILYSIYGLNTLLFRSILTTVGHMTYAAIWGYVTGVVIYSRNAGKSDYSNSIVVTAVAIAAVLHGIYNFMLEIGLPFFAFAVDIFTLSVALWSLSYLNKLSPYRKFPLDQYKTAIPQIRQALASNPDNFALHKRIGLHYIRAGKQEAALAHMKKAAMLKKKELSSRFYRDLLSSVSNDAYTEEQGYRKLYKTAAHIPLRSLRNLRSETRSAFHTHPRKAKVDSIVEDLIKQKKEGGTLEIPAGHRSSAGFTSPETNHDAGPSEQKIRASRRILEEKQRELENN